MGRRSGTLELKRARCFCCLVGWILVPRIVAHECTDRTANTPHNPVRFADTIGIVIEATRPTESNGKLTWLALTLSVADGCSDSLQWYCREPVHTKPTIIHKETFHVTDLGTQLKPVIQRWQNNEELRTCKECGKVAPPK